MVRGSPGKDLSLRSLELFQLSAQQGSLQAASDETGLSVSTISHHLRSLERCLGVELFDHSRRPMVMTPKGKIFLNSIEGALLAIRKAKAEASSGNIEDASCLRFGTIEDFDSDLIPEMAVLMAAQMPKCEFTYQTGTSQSVVEMLNNRHLDLGITSASPEPWNDLIDRPLLRDPFVVVIPKSTEQTLEQIVEGKSKLPFLRFSKNLVIANQIEAQLRRLGFSSSNRFESDNNQTLMAMVAAGAGWTITTPLLYSRAKRFQSRVAMYQFPDKGFSRTLALVATPDCSTKVLELVEATARTFLQKMTIAPMHRNAPWLIDSFKLL